MRIEMDPTHGRGPGRPRSAEADRAILEATISVLADVGYQRLTIEEVAARAGVSKATIYRRHPSKISLVAAVAATTRNAVVPRLDTGSFQGDLLALGEHGLQRLNSLWGRVLAGILSEAADDPEVAQVLEGHFGWRLQAYAEIVERGIARGEVRPGTDARLVFTMMDGPLLMELMILRGQIDSTLLHRLVEEVIEGVAVR